MRRLRVKLGAEFMTVGVLTVSLLGSFPARAQSARDSSSNFSSNTIYVELGGAGGLYSVNYDHRISKEIGFRLGFTAWSIVTGFPVTLNYLVGSKGHYLELGIGAVLGFTSFQNRSFVESALRVGQSVGTATIGYRYQPHGGGLLFRIAFTPLFPPNHFYPWGGISFGYAF